MEYTGEGTVGTSRGILVRVQRVLVEYTGEGTVGTSRGILVSGVLAVRMKGVLLCILAH